MSHLELHTDRLRLVLQSAEEVLARIDALSAAERAEVSPDWLARMRASASAGPWTHGFAMMDLAHGTVIGSCGYRGPPDVDGVVEIAYAVDPGYQGQGYATEAARALVDHAFASGEVHVVRAHTLPGPNASTGVLVKCGFESVGEVVDPEDGPVWRWEKRIAGAERLEDLPRADPLVKQGERVTDAAAKAARRGLRQS